MEGITAVEEYAVIFAHQESKGFQNRYRADRNFVDRANLIIEGKQEDEFAICFNRAVHATTKATTVDGKCW